MEKSIENIWKDGFLEKDALIAPKINNLYDQKSKSLIDKLKRMHNINIKAIVIGSVGIFILYYLMAVPWAGFIIFLLLNIVALVSHRRMKKMHEIDRNQNSFEYLQSIDHWIKKNMKANVKMMRVFYPLIMLCSLSTIWFANNNKETLGKLIAQHPDWYLIYGIPVSWLAVATLIVALAIIFAKQLYFFDVKIVYGRVFKKIEELIADMEELRN